jgi:hypothetical protein
MKLSLIVTGMLFLPILGCGQDPKFNEIKAKIGQQKADNDELIRQVLARTKPLNDPALKDVFCRGGQPGNVTLTGALVDHSSSELKPIDQIKIEKEAGISWRGVRASLKEPSPIFKSDLSDTEKLDLVNLKSDKYWINVGCRDLTHMPGQEDLELAEIDPKSPILSAKSVIVCDPSMLTATLISINAELVVFHEMKVSIRAAVTQFLFIKASNLRLEGSNSIHAEGIDSTVTALPGPEIFLAAESLSGTGNLKIDVHGGNYLKPDSVKP